MELEDRLLVPGAEGIDLELVLAGVGSRALALLVDLLLQWLLLAVLAWGLSQFGDLGAAGLAIAGFLVLLGYPIAFEAFNGGRTLGKMWLGIAAVSDDGTPLRFVQAVVRNVIRPVDALPGTYFVGLVAILATDRSQRLGDLAAGSLVVRRPRTRGAVPTVAAPPAVAASVPVGWDVSAVTAEEVAAVRAFLGRRAGLASPARAELAATLAGRLRPKVAGVPDHDGPEPFLERIVQAKLAS